VASRQALKALDLCLNYNIKISEDMGEKLSAADVGSDEKLKILNKIAEVAYQQGNYHLATKKWTQAGNRLQVTAALLCLIRPLQFLIDINALKCATKVLF
jgi:intraflagellar transport protein 140